ncbi:hypothetical protein WICPIJ_009749 [Wickerhamomyces pijperi]|uniref:Sm domain-containing protein n=1 Tax=Wickerhamomyces pijperi TaxID=599730 RepID=A0A9P8TCQ3_WICPI|nr:hypothetical protein WICPIJ_009749 [Wickerhamomyces pijperi]
MDQVTNPKPFVKSLLNKRISVRLKFNNTTYEGLLESSDNYFNLSLSNVTEVTYNETDGEVKERVSLGDGKVFIRCNNVLYIRQLSDEELKAIQQQELDEGDVKDQ